MQLAAIFKTLLSDMVMLENYEPMIIFRLLVLSHTFYIEVDNKKIFLDVFLRNHSIWKIKNLWV